MKDVFRATTLTFGIQIHDNVTHALLPLSLTKRKINVYALKISLSTLVILVFNVSSQAIGILIKEDVFNVLKIKYMIE